MQCDIRSALFKNYKERLEEYEQAVVRLKTDGDPWIRTDYVLLWRLTERARGACLESQRKLEDHMMQHKCYFESGHAPAAVTA